MKKVVLFIFIATSLFLFSSDLVPVISGKAESVRCAIPKFEPAFEQAAAVFVGKVLSKKSEGQTKVFEMEVEKFWKGVDEKNITIYVNENPRYQAQFEVGESYLVFAEKDEDDGGKLFDRRCSRTKLIQTEYGDLEEDLQKLGDARICINLGEK